MNDWGLLDSHSTLSKEAIDDLLDKYEETRQQALEYTVGHQNDLPLAKYAAPHYLLWLVTDDC